MQQRVGVKKKRSILELIPQEKQRGKGIVASFYSGLSGVCCGGTGVDRYPSCRADDGCDKADLYLETHQRGLLKMENNGYVRIKWGH